MKKTIFPDFNNKVVLVGIATDDYSYSMNCPRWETQGGRLFLAGTVPRGGSGRDWAEGAVRAVAWDEVTDYLVFDSIKDFHKRHSKFKRKS
jgi:hypothetical protein